MTSAVVFQVAEAITGISLPVAGGLAGVAKWRRQLAREERRLEMKHHEDKQRMALSLEAQIILDTAERDIELGHLLTANEARQRSDTIEALRDRCDGLFDVHKSLSRMEFIKNVAEYKGKSAVKAKEISSDADGWDAGFV